MTVTARLASPPGLQKVAAAAGIVKPQDSVGMRCTWSVEMGQVQRNSLTVWGLLAGSGLPTLGDAWQKFVYGLGPEQFLPCRVQSAEPKEPRP